MLSGSTRFRVRALIRDGDRPYFSYAKGDKKDEPRVRSARESAPMRSSGGADRVVTLDLHASQIQGSSE